MLDEEAPVVECAIVIVGRLAPLGEAGDAGLARVWWDAAEEVEFDEAVELPRGELVLAPEGLEEREVEELRGRHADTDAFGGQGWGDRGV